MRRTGNQNKPKPGRWRLQVLVCGVLITSGCMRKEQNPERLEYNELNPKLAKLNKIYFNGTASQARESLLQEEELLKHVKSKSLRTIGLELAYARLHVLEKCEGDTNSACIFLEKYKQVHRDSSDPLNRDMNWITSEHVRESVLKMDANVHPGKEPNYRMRSINNSDSAPPKPTP